MTEGSVQAVLDSVSTEDLVRSLEERKAALTKRLGRSAMLKRAVRCPGCDAETGVRELLRHKKVCPDFLAKRAKAIKESGTKKVPSEWAFTWGKK